MDPHARKNHRAQGLIHSPTRSILRDCLRSPGDGFGAGPDADPNAMIMTFRTTGAAETVTIPCQAGTFNATIDWGDSSTSEITAFNDADLAHEYATADDYTVTITGTFPNLFFNSAGDRLKLIDIQQWGDTGFSGSLASMFSGCSNMDISASDGPVITSAVTSLSRMFLSCTSMTTPPDTSSWNTSAVNNISFLFYNCPSMTIPPDTSNWNTSSVADVSQMFYNCSSMTTAPDTSGWDTSSMNTMASTFLLCSSMTTPPDMSGWITAAVRDMSKMFQTCTSMVGLDPSTLDITGLNGTGDLTNFATGVTVATADYDATLIAWAAQVVFAGMAPTFGAGTKYTGGGAAETARTSLVNDDLWVITDGGVA